MSRAISTLRETGHFLIDQSQYGFSDTEAKKLQSSYADLLPDPYGEQRNRAYLKLHFNTCTGETSLQKDQSYSQTYLANNQDGGKIRQFEPMPPSIADSEVFYRMVRKNVSMMLEWYDFSKESITIGLHTVHYICKNGQPSYSSPVWLHRDDEPLVMITLINQSTDLVGADSILADNSKTINAVIHLEPFESLLLTKDILHAVTPMQAPRNAETGYRDVLLTTVEEADDVLSLKSQTCARDKKSEYQELHELKSMG